MRPRLRAARGRAAPAGGRGHALAPPRGCGCGATARAWPARRTALARPVLPARATSWLPSSARASVRTSSSFCTARDSQLWSSSSSSASKARSTGACSSEHDGAIHSRSPSAAAGGASVRSAASRSVRQMLRPLTMPADRTLAPSDGQARRRAAPAPARRSACRPGHRQGGGGRQVVLQAIEVGCAPAASPGAADRRAYGRVRLRARRRAGPGARMGSSICTHSTPGCGDAAQALPHRPGPGRPAVPACRHRPGPA